MKRFRCSKKNPFVRMCFWICFCGFLSISSTTWSQSIDYSARKFDFSFSPYGLIQNIPTISLNHLQFHVGVGSYYAQRPLFLLDNNNQKQEWVSSRFASEIWGSIGFWKWLDVGMSLPVVWRQWQKNVPNHKEDGITGLGDLRFQAKAQLFQSNNGFGIGLSFDVTVPISPSNLFLRSTSIEFRPKILLDFRASQGTYVSLNMGYLWREKASFQNWVVGQEIPWNLGFSIPLFFNNLRILFEFNGSFALPHEPVLAGFENVVTHTVEVLLAFKWIHSSGVSLTLGGGSGLTSSPGSPLFRFFFRIDWTRKLRNIVFDTDRLPTIHKKIGPDEKVQHSYFSSGFDGKRIQEKENVLSASMASRWKLPSSSQEKRAFQKYKKPNARQFQRAIQEDPDRDGDGIPNEKDKCPDQAEDFDGFQDEDGCPDDDNDQDGIPDKKDKCPNQKETVNGFQDKDGCPDEVKTQGNVFFAAGKIQIKQKIFFDSGSDKIKSQSFSILKEVARFLKNAWQVEKIRIEGHTDGDGDKEKNVDLSERRARRVMSFLLQEGVAPKMLSAKGFGSRIPLTNDKTKEGKSKNRRVDFVVKKMKKTPTKPLSLHPKKKRKP